MHQLLSQAVAIYFEVRSYLLSRDYPFRTFIATWDQICTLGLPKWNLWHYFISEVFHVILIVLLLKKKTSAYGSQGDWIQIALWVNRCNPSINLATTGSYSLISYTHVAAFKSNLRSPIWFLVSHSSPTCIYCIPHSFVYYLYRSHASRIHMMVSLWMVRYWRLHYSLCRFRAHVYTLWCGHQSFTSHFHPLSSVSVVFVHTVTSYIPRNKTV